ncbi:KTSC domain-containing protein [Clostridium tetani]|uniref:KTSC domain-containing protein n=1 Tax=Clostridium tetani TaxID=1513 RepID=UPI00100B5C66|nr:KTSC domain-containing protein [Clostridium tetani]RXI46074.1 KTSC domain-containing protein [Clostridium tetani]RXM61466.1 KTSC domain-containing protein [Clostridium tetani]RXM70291.1 KTSC domain-containing protein [Clostridium tetani]
MQRTRVSSSNVYSIGYDDSSSILEVQFNNGSIYQYSNVPYSIYQGLMSAASHGSYLHAHVKGIYLYRRIA